MVAPELRWPMTPATPSSTSFCATVVAVLGSAASSSLFSLEHDLLAAQGESGGVDFIQRQARAVFVVLAQMRLGAGERGGLANQHDLAVVAILLWLVAASRDQRAATAIATQL